MSEANQPASQVSLNQGSELKVEGTVPLYQKVAFGVGSLANQLFAAALGVFMIVLVMGLGMDTTCGDLRSGSSAF